MENEEIQTETPVVETPKLASQRIAELSTDIDFGLPPEQNIDYVMKDYTMTLSPELSREMIRNSGIQSSFGEQVSTGVQGVLAGLSMLPDQASIAYGNLTNYFSGGKIGEDLQNAAFDNLQKRMADIGYNEEAIGGITDWLAQLVTGGASFMELALVSMATGGAGGIAQIVTQEMGEGFYNDMQAYLDTHGSLEGYKPKGSDVALNIANTILQAGIESYLGVGSPRFLTGWSRGLWKEGLSGFGQEFAQGALSDFNEFLKGNTEAQDLMEQADQWVRDGIVGGVLQGTLGAATYGTARRKHDMLVARAHAMYKGRKEPNKEDMDIAKKLGDLKEQGYGSAFTEEFKKRFDATSPVGQLQQKIATAINDAYKAGKIDFGGASETQIAQKIESFAAQETLNAMEDSAERKQSIGEHELNSIVFKGAEGAKEGELWLAGLEPEVGERSVDLAKVLEYRQSGLAEINAELEVLDGEIKQLKKQLAETTVDVKEAQKELLKEQIKNKEGQAEAKRLKKSQLEASNARLYANIEKMSAPKAEKASEQKSLKAEREQEKAVKEQRKQAREKKPATAKKEETKLKTTPTVISNGTVSFKVNLVDEQQDGSTILTEESARALLKEYEENLHYKNVDIKTIKDKEERARIERIRQHLRDIEYNIEYIKYYAGEESSYSPKDAREIVEKWRKESATQQDSGTATELTKSKKRVKESAEVYTPKWVVNDMLNALPEETWQNIDATFLEPAGGNGNFVEEILRRKLSIAKTEEEKIRALKSVYAIELMLDNVDEMRTRVKIIMEEHGVVDRIDYIINRNIQQGNFLSGENIFGDDISFYDWLNDGTDTLKDMIARSKKKEDEPLEQGLLFQSRPDQSRLDKGDTYRGAYDEKLKRIILNEKSDLTTIQHEFAHYWIQNNFRWYRSGLASDDWKRNWERVEQALGIEPTDKYLSKVASEKFARAYERYIMEGKVAPEYQWAFAEFQEFYNEAYEDLKAEYFDLNEELSPELIDWFNRQRPVAPEQVAEMRQNQVRSAIAQAPDNTIIESVGDGYAVVEENEQGEIESTIVVPKETIAEEQFGVPAKKTKSGLQESLRKRFGDDVNVDELVALDSVETLAQAESIIASNQQLAWEQMLSDSTNDVKRAYLYKAFAKMAENDPQIAVDLSNTNMAQWAREKGQAIQALNINDELGLSPHTILAYMKNAKGKMSQEQLTQALNEIDLYAELSAEDTTSLENETECLL